MANCNQKAYIPYRSSKLTRILQKYLNKNCKIVLLATIDSINQNVCETISTLKFASRCR